MAPRPDKMPYFLSIAALAQDPVVDNEWSCRANIRIFLDACNEHHDPSPYAPTEPQFFESDYVVDFEDCVQNQEDVMIERLVVGSKVGERL